MNVNRRQRAQRRRRSERSHFRKQSQPQSLGKWRSRHPPCLLGAPPFFAVLAHDAPLCLVTSAQTTHQCSLGFHDVPIPTRHRRRDALRLGNQLVVDDLPPPPPRAQPTPSRNLNRIRKPASASLRPLVALRNARYACAARTTCMRLGSSRHAPAQTVAADMTVAMRDVISNPDAHRCQGSKLAASRAT